MIRGHEDWFVAAVAVAVGVFLFVCAITNWSWYYSLRTAQLLERGLGRPRARVFHALLGIGLVALGIAIGFGFRLPLFGR